MEIYERFSRNYKPGIKQPVKKKENYTLYYDGVAQIGNTTRIVCVCKMNELKQAGNVGKYEIK
jgi:hypothetical protein